MYFKKAALVVLLVAVFFGYGRNLFAQDNKKESLQTQIENLEKEIQQYKTQLSQVGTQRATLESTLANQRLGVKKLNAELQLVISKIKKVESGISTNRKENSMTELSAEEQKHLLSRSLRKLAWQEDHTIMETWLLGDSLQDIITERSRVDAVGEAVTNQVERLTNVMQNLDKQHEELQDKKTELQKLQKEASEKKKLVDLQVAETKQLIAQTKNQESVFQQQLKTKEALQAAYEKELFDYEASLTFNFDATSIPKAGSAPLSWPLEKVYITQKFGVTSASGRLYASGSHSGSDFRANSDPVYAMADGIVEGIGDTDKQCPGASFGKFVFIRYTNGLASTYGHLSLITAREGQKVRRGDLVAYSGNTGHSTGPHLHVSLYVSNNKNGTPAVKVEAKESLSCKGKVLYQPIAPRSSYLDPLLYMPKYTGSMIKPGA